MGQVGVVAIGRNEGDRLRKCLESVVRAGADAVYVDSGSTDGSVSLATSLGVAVVPLDMSTPFTAARARNSGFAYLREHFPDVEFVQFVDGDCEFHPDWLGIAAAALREHPDWAAVNGRCRERHPDASIYNRLCDIEWNTPVGEATAFGGNVMLRVKALADVGGFNPTIIAAEDTELGVRLRLAGWKLFRLDHEMVLHDAAIFHFKQWWKRAIRGGHGFAENRALHGKSEFRHWVRETNSIWFWGLGVPIVALAGAWPTYGLSLALFAGYPLLIWKIARSAQRQGLSGRDAHLFAFFCVLAKFPQALGQIRYWNNRLRGRGSRIIEYKLPPAPAEALLGSAP